MENSPFSIIFANEKPQLVQRNADPRAGRDFLCQGGDEGEDERGKEWKINGNRAKSGNNWVDQNNLLAAGAI